MRYIKLFEHLLNYSKISLSEFNDLVYIDGNLNLSKFETFTEEEVNMINSYLPNFDFELYDSWNEGEEYRVNNSMFMGDNFDGVLKSGESGTLISILKLKDEWYIITISNYISSSKAIDTSYKCDQLNGLEDFLKNNRFD